MPDCDLSDMALDVRNMVAPAPLPIISGELNDKVSEFLQRCLPKVRAVGRQVRLAIYNTECVHAQVRAHVGAGDLGQTRDAATNNAQHILDRAATHQLMAHGFLSKHDLDKEQAAGAKAAGKGAWSLKRDALGRSTGKSIQ